MKEKRSKLSSNGSKAVAVGTHIVAFVNGRGHFACHLCAVRMVRSSRPELAVTDEISVYGRLISCHFVWNSSLVPSRSVYSPSKSHSGDGPSVVITLLIIIIIIFIVWNVPTYDFSTARPSLTSTILYPPALHSRTAVYYYYHYPDTCECLFICSLCNEFAGFLSLLLIRINFRHIRLCYELQTMLSPLPSSSPHARAIWPNQMENYYFEFEVCPVRSDAKWWWFNRYTFAQILHNAMAGGQP